MLSFYTPLISQPDVESVCAGVSRHSTPTTPPRVVLGVVRDGSSHLSEKGGELEWIVVSLTTDFSQGCSWRTQYHAGPQLHVCPCGTILTYVRRGGEFSSPVKYFAFKSLICILQIEVVVERRQSQFLVSPLEPKVSLTAHQFSLLQKRTRHSSLQNPSGLCKAPVTKASIKVLPDPLPAFKNKGYNLPFPACTHLSTVKLQLGPALSSVLYQVIPEVQGEALCMKE